MAEFFDYDPVSGLTYKTDYSWADNTITLRSEQDVQPHLDMTHKIRRGEGMRIEGDWWLYASIPPSVELILLEKYKLNINKKEDFPKAMKVIETDFPYLKCTNKKHVFK